MYSALDCLQISEQFSTILSESATIKQFAPANTMCLSSQLALKLADLGHLSAPLAVHLRWVAALEEEFFKQGDAEKAFNLTISPLFDRKQPGVTKSQVSQR